MLKIIVDFHHYADKAVSKGAPIFKITELPITGEIIRMKTSVPNEKVSNLDDLENRMQKNFEELEDSLR